MQPSDANTWTSETILVKSIKNNTSTFIFLALELATLRKNEHVTTYFLGFILSNRFIAHLLVAARKAIFNYIFLHNMKSFLTLTSTVRLLQYGNQGLEVRRKNQLTRFHMTDTLNVKSLLPTGLSDLILTFILTL